ncbi:hypothetical protein A3Q33_04780 [Colwellia sp. PAMC 21821]|nr:hypothetical protein A3Q33_04780 [Colwellia sp. PAMC 21821]
MANFFIKYCSMYKNWDKNSITIWERRKQEGIVKFVLLEGIVKWGVFSTIIFLSMTITGEELRQVEIVTTCLIWLVASIIYGSSLWYGTSLAYKKYLK